MIQFKKLRLSGFKSFVDRTELDIAPGLTGIVGPNGCGKSNVVEALRWAMGETSAKRMRGGSGMEDVIFNGTSTRPPRNFAEVSILLDNTALSAPAAYNNNEEIEITRRIEKDQGSLYKINGKIARARDVQMLFADTVTGANSPALVSQGRVTAMINAKPQERRLILEESAGISGIYARRHEAELRLRAADQNLQRLDDLVGSMDNRLNTLKKQARQAQKYKNLSDEIKKLEVTIAYLEWRLVGTRIHEAQSKFSAAESIVAEKLTAVTQLTKTQNVQSEDLPALRKTESETAAALQVQKVTLQRLEDERKGYETQLTDAKEQLLRLNDDREHEKQSLSESVEILEKIDREEEEIQNNQKQEVTASKEKVTVKQDLEDKVTGLENDYNEFMEQSAELKAQHQALERQITADESRKLVAQERIETLTEKLASTRQEFENDETHNNLKAEIIELEKDVAALRTESESALKAYESSQKELETARDNQQELSQKKSEIITEISTLESILNSDSQDKFRPILDDIQPEPGFETALSRALGDTLMASTDKEAPIYWIEREFDNSDFPSFQAGIEKLEPHVKAPTPLKAALQLIGIVENEEQGNNYARTLKPGQSLVSKEGAYWRWDGLQIKSSASDKHALGLQQKNRLAELYQQSPDIEKRSAEADKQLSAAQEVKDQNNEAVELLNSQLREKEDTLRRQQGSLNATTENRSSLFADIAKYEEALALGQEEIKLLDSNIDKNKHALKSYDDQSAIDQANQGDAMRKSLLETRESLQEAVRALDNLTQEQNRRKARLHAIADERINMQNRSIRARERLKELDSREIQLKEKIKTLEEQPNTIESDRAELLDKITEVEKTRNIAADELAKKETELAVTSKALKEAESNLSDAKEDRASAQATMEAGQQQLDEIIASIESHFEQSPESLIEEIDLELNDEDLPDIDTYKTQKEKAVRQRDIIGPVNLRAEIEADELEQEVGGILDERNDLLQAIEELRDGIETLNKEARERLLGAFDHVNGHFQRLFTQLYDGGQARLELIESDDPLTSGLEIYAQPPGKTLQSLSLLSGGEQTLASIALIFAMFLTNPSPICVLDEIDAPLDDANVDRVCDLLEEIAERGETRFLIITHHRLTMARMDRLYGVTMAEKGVSQLVSVDLNQQLDFLEAAE